MRASQRKPFSNYYSGNPPQIDIPPYMSDKMLNRQKLLVVASQGFDLLAVWVKNFVASISKEP